MHKTGIYIVARLGFNTAAWGWSMDRDAHGDFGAGAHAAVAARWKSVGCAASPSYQHPRMTSLADFRIRGRRHDCRHTRSERHTYPPLTYCTSSSTRFLPTSAQIRFHLVWMDDPSFSTPGRIASRHAGLGKKNIVSFFFLLALCEVSASICKTLALVGLRFCKTQAQSRSEQTVG
jgi:hypothetical protein